MSQYTSSLTLFFKEGHHHNNTNYDQQSLCESTGLLGKSDIFIKSILNSIPPPLVPTIYSCKHITRQLPKFIGTIEPLEPLAEDINPKPSTENSKYLNEIFKTIPSNIVYERIYPEGVPLKEKKGYYLTTLFNIKRYVYMQKLDNSMVDSRATKEDPTFVYKPTNELDNTLLFESRFESGNLAAALKVNENEYDLFVQNDINTLGHTQWFYFRVSNKSKLTAKLNIKNFLKGESLFNAGMKVRVYSQTLAHTKSIGWHRAGANISYFQNELKKSVNSKKNYYTLSFTYDFTFENDIVFFAYDKPYTYTDLQEKLRDIEKDPFMSKYMHNREYVLEGYSADQSQETE
jgi:Cytosolic carboxypeptidase N-terminal domain